MKDARAIRARAAMGLGLGNLGNEGFRRDESLLRSEEATAPSPRMDEARTQVALLEHMTGGGILGIKAGCCGELPHKYSFWLNRKTTSAGTILRIRKLCKPQMRKSHDNRFGFLARDNHILNPPPKSVQRFLAIFAIRQSKNFWGGGI